MSRYQFIEQQRASYPVRLLCQVLGVTPSHYYAWGVRGAKVPELLAPAAWELALFQMFTYRKQRYGTRRLRAELQAQGYRVGRQRLRDSPAPSRVAGRAAQGLYPAHDRLHLWPALRP